MSSVIFYLKVKPQLLILKFFFKFRKLGLEDTDSELDEEIAKKNNQMFGF